MKHWVVTHQTDCLIPAESVDEGQIGLEELLSSMHICYLIIETVLGCDITAGKS